MDEETRLGIDATQAFATLRKLQQEFSRYAKGVNSAADASDDFNSRSFPARVCQSLESNKIREIRKVGQDGATPSFLHPPSTPAR